MIKSKIKNLLIKKEKGQTLLVVIVISTITMLLILGMADRIAIAQVNVKRTAEFDRSIAIAENRVNDVIRAVDTQAVKDCINQKITAQTTTFQILNCTDIADQTFLESRVYARVSPDTSIAITRDVPMSIILSEDVDAGGVSTTGIVAKCSAANTSRFEFTRIFRDANGDIGNDKGIAQCDDAALQNNTLTLAGNIPLYYSATTPVQVSGVGGYGTVRQNTLAIRVKALDEGNTNQATLIDLRVTGDSNADGAPDVIATTGKYEFLVAGFGEFGSDSLVTFTRPLDSVNNYSPTLFDYAYLGEDF